MIVFLVSFLVSLIPTLAVFWWMRNMRREDAAYRKLCDKAFRDGIISTFPVIAVSGTLSLILHLTGLKDTHPLLYEGLHSFIVLALAEETVKFLTFRHALRKADYTFSYLDMTVMMTLVGLGFGAMENLVLAISSGVGVMLIRAVSLAHGGYGFVVGYFYSKGVKSGKKGHKALGFVLVWLIHGMYDFSLSEEFTSFNEDLSAIIAVNLAILSVVLAVVLIVFLVRARKNEFYTEPLEGATGGSADMRTEGETPQI